MRRGLSTVARIAFPVAAVLAALAGTAHACTPPKLKAVCAAEVPWDTRWKFTRKDFSGACFYSNGADLVAISSALMTNRVGVLDSVAQAACAAGLRAPEPGPRAPRELEVAFFPFDPGSPGSVFGLVHNRWLSGSPGTIARQSFFLAVDTRARNAEGAIGSETLSHEYMHLVQARYPAFPRAISATGKPVAEWIREGTAEAVGQSWTSSGTLSREGLKPAGAGQFPHGRFALPLILRKLPDGQDAYQILSGERYPDPRNPPFTYLTWPFWEFVALKLSDNGYGYLETLYGEQLAAGDGAAGVDAALRKIRGNRGGGLVESYLEFLSYITRRKSLYPDLSELHDREDFFDCQRPDLVEEFGTPRRWRFAPGGADGAVRVAHLAAKCIVIEIPASSRPMVLQLQRGMASFDGERFENPKVHLMIGGEVIPPGNLMRVYPPDSAGRPREIFMLVTAGDKAAPADKTPQRERLAFSITELPEKCTLADIEALRAGALKAREEKRAETRCGTGWKVTAR